MYVPDAREVGDERVYAQNVRDHMAKWLHVGTVDESVGMTNSGKGFRRTDLGSVQQSRLPSQFAATVEHSDSNTGLLAYSDTVRSFLLTVTFFF